MTTGGYPPPGGDRPLGTSSGTTSRPTVGEQASRVGETTLESGGKVMETAKEQAQQVTSEARAQARNLMQEAQSAVRDQAGSQKQKASGGLRNLGQELRSMAESASDQSSPASQLTRQAAEQAQALASWLDKREPGDLVEQLRSFARRRPGMFLLGAAAAGVAAGRLTRGAVDASRQRGEGAEPYRPTAYGERPVSTAVPATGAPTLPPQTGAREEEYLEETAPTRPVPGTVPGEPGRGGGLQ